MRGGSAVIYGESWSSIKVEFKNDERKAGPSVLSDASTHVTLLPPVTLPSGAVCHDVVTIFTYGFLQLAVPSRSVWCSRTSTYRVAI
jgi:hypothetical protein